MKSVSSNCVAKFFFAVLLFSQPSIALDSYSRFDINQSSFATTYGSGPDKWASVWLIRRFINPSPIKLIENENGLNLKKELIKPTTLLFDTAGAKYDRTGSSTTYSALLAAHNIRDESALKLGKLVHEIEIDAWQMAVSLESQLLEQAFRRMQLEYGRTAVTQSCYMEFFDRASVAIQGSRMASIIPSELVPEKDCLDDNARESTTNGMAVETLPLQQVLRKIGDGENVVFIDTREQWEYNEGHIPGAINLQLRDIDKQAIAAHALGDADLVIAYCVKDFRGFEVAKTLRKYNIAASIMNPYGMRGWIATDLPVSGGKYMSETDGIRHVRLLARSPKTGN